MTMKLAKLDNLSISDSQSGASGLLPKTVVYKCRNFVKLNVLITGKDSINKHNQKIQEGEGIHTGVMLKLK